MASSRGPSTVSSPRRATTARGGGPMVKQRLGRHAFVRLFRAMVPGATALALFCATPAPVRAADPVVGQEIASGQPVLLQFNTGFNPVASSDGHNFIVAFEDNSRIRAVRADGNGRVLDVPWLDLGEGATQINAAITFGAGNYLVTWDEIGADFGASVHGRGQRFVVAWLAIGEGGFNNVHAALVDATGPVPGSEHAVSTTGTASTVSVASSVDESVIAWDDFGGPFAN